MPISRINPDGTVKIVNNKTGQVLDVSPQELPKYSPTLVGEYQSKLNEQEVVNQASKAISTGGIKIEDLPAEQRLQVVTKLQGEGVQIPTDKTAADKKKQDTLNSATNLIKNLEKNYQEAGGGEVDVPILSRIIGKSKDIGGSLGFNESANVYNKQREGFVGALKALSGEAGALTDQDIKRLQGLLPGLGSRPEEAKKLFNDLRSQIEATYGGEVGDTTINPKRKGITDVFLGDAKKVAQDINAGLIAKGTEKTRNQASGVGFETANKLEQQAMNEQDPTKKKQILKQAMSIYQGVGENAQDTRQTFSEDVYGNPLTRGLSASSQIATVAEAPSTIKSAAQIIANPKKLAPKLFTSKAALGQAREAAAKNVNIDTKSLLQAGDDYVRNIDPAAQRSWEVLKSSIKDDTPATELLDKISNWGNKAYTTSGDKRAITEGLLKSHLYETGRKVIKEQAPDIAKLTEELAKKIGQEKLVKKSIFPAAIGAGVSAGVGIPVTLALTKLAGQR